MMWCELQVGDMLVDKDASKPSFVLVRVTDDGHGVWLSTATCTTTIDEWSHLATDEEDLDNDYQVWRMGVRLT